MNSIIKSNNRFLFLFAFVLSSTFSNLTSQEKYTTSDFNLPKDVVKYETIRYAYNQNTKTFVWQNSYTYEFKDGKLAFSATEDNSAFSIANDNKKYEYDSNGKLVKTTSGSSLLEYSDYFTYDNKGRLTLISNRSETNPSTTTFTYNNKGFLLSVVKKTGSYIDEEFSYYDYTDKNNYKYKENYYQYKSTEKLYTSEFVVKNGLKISEKRINAKGELIRSDVFGYDTFNHLTSIIDKNGDSTIYSIGYDEKGTEIKSRRGDIGGNFYNAFSKVTYKDGTTSGNTDFAPYFTAGLQSPLLKMPYNVNPRDKYKVRKTGQSTFDVQNSKGVILTKPSEGLIFEQKDFLFYDAGNGENSILFGLFTDAYKANEWYDLLTFNSPSGKYIVVNSDWRFFIFEKGKSADITGLTLHKGIDGNTLVVNENGKEKYFVPYLNQIQALVIYPLEPISK